MALNILSIPTMWADPKRLFLGAKITIIDRRNRLRIKLIKALKSLKLQINILELKGNKIKDNNKELSRGNTLNIINKE